MLAEIIKVGLLFLTYLVSSTSLVVIFFQISRCAREQALSFFYICLSVGPVFLSFVLSILLVILPNQTAQFYLAVTLLILFCPFVFFPTQFKLLSATIKYLIKEFAEILCQFNLTSMVFYFFIAVIFLLFLNALIFPLTGNDSLEYAQVGRILFNEHNLSIYPVLDSSSTRGFYAPWSHPPAYVVLHFWGFLIQGSADYAGVIRFTAPYFLVATALTLAHFAGSIRSYAGCMAALVYVSTPMVFWGGLDGSVDPLRIATFFSAILAIYIFRHRDKWELSVLVLLLVFALYSHSINILILPIFLALFPLLRSGSWKSRLSYVAVIACISVLLTPSYFKNIYLFGNVVSDMPDLWALDHLQYKEYFAIERGIDGIARKIVNGVLKGWSNLQLFGITYWLFLISTIAWLLGKYKQFGKEIKKLHSRSYTLDLSLMSFTLLIVIGFYSGVILSVLLGLDILIKNARYLLVAQPFISLFIGIFLSRLAGVGRPFSTIIEKKRAI
ncbi:MAG: hypothetical protein R2772_11800 [Chitinophagales bacterium]